jgi:hypothetical protein
MRTEQVRIFLAAMIAAFQLASYIGAHAHGDDKPKREGTMGRGDDAVSIELVMEEGVVALYVIPAGGGQREQPSARRRITSFRAQRQAHRAVASRLIPERSIGPKSTQCRHANRLDSR